MRRNTWRNIGEYRGISKDFGIVSKWYGSSNEWYVNTFYTVKEPRCVSTENLNRDDKGAEIKLILWVEVELLKYRNIARTRLRKNKRI
jgi:hypothetical protein